MEEEIRRDRKHNPSKVYNKPEGIFREEKHGER